jgi:3-methylfumaryl-CoA hydratase
MTEIDVAALSAWTGRSMEAEDRVTSRLVAEFRATFEDKLAPVPDGAAPLALHWCLAPETPKLSRIGHDGHAAKGEFLPPVPLPRRMWAGGEVEFLDHLRLDDRVVRRSTVGKIAFKQGRTGPLCFVAVHHEVAGPRGVAIRERHDMVYRDAGTSAAAPPPAAPTQSDLDWTVEASPVLLFRYSAMTFNGHRIHYDLPYVTEVEGYQGLVVHGPVQATLLLQAAAVLGGNAPRGFRYRALSPLIAGRSFRVRGRLTEGGAVCRVENGDGIVTMEAEAFR